MADIRPFRGVHYNASLIKDWSAVICPVYDIITPQQQQELYRRSEYNFVRLEFGRDLPQDTVADNKYARSAATLEQWLKQGILETDTAPAIYLHDQYFKYQGRGYKRRGIVTRVRLEQRDKKVVRPHEGTMAEPKRDRISLLWALQANTSPIFTLFEDRGKRISSLLATQAQGEPIFNLKSVDGEAHIIWAITDPEVINQISSSFAGQPLYIADGHHRYESALDYQRERLAGIPSASGEEAFNFVMMTLIDFADPGLLILPPHRLVRGIPKSALDGLMTKLKVFFEVEHLALNSPDVWERIDALPAKKNEIRIVLFGPDAERLFVLRLYDLAAISQMMPYFHSELYKRLDVSIVDHVIMENLLASSGNEGKATLAYSYDRVEAVKRVLNQEYQLAFLLTPIKAEVIKAIADVGDRMPRKSTYFYPKLPAGIIVNRLV
ncbi:MAG: DUF1015 domain-containing protein [Dehalococcoidales bacterium]|nr:DUF1015 domain-containing protein [Dehalococcoidales bacterium]